MNVKATSVNDWKTFKATRNALLFKGRNPLLGKMLGFSGIWIIVAFLLGKVIFFPSEATHSNDVALALLFLGVSILMYFFCYHVAWRFHHKKELKQSGEMITEFTFGRERMNVREVPASFEDALNSLRTVNYNLAYSDMAKIVETNDYILIFVDLTHVYAVDKSRIENGGAKDIREAMQAAAGEKYKIVNY